MMAEIEQFNAAELKLIHDALVCTLACLDRDAEDLRRPLYAVVVKVQKILNASESA